jgi:hypothetical protein
MLAPPFGLRQVSVFPEMEGWQEDQAAKKVVSRK